MDVKFSPSAGVSTFVVRSACRRYIYKIYKYIGTPRAGATRAFIPDFENAVRTDYAVITIPPLVVVIAARYVHHYYHDLFYSLSSNFIHIINRLLSPSILNSYVPPAPIHIKRRTVLSFCINFLHKWILYQSCRAVSWRCWWQYEQSAWTNYSLFIIEIYYLVGAVRLQRRVM